MSNKFGFVFAFFWDDLVHSEKGGSSLYLSILGIGVLSGLFTGYWAAVSMVTLCGLIIAASVYLAVLLFQSEWFYYKRLDLMDWLHEHFNW